jgi:P4 family phage/plasmid primase-like protien
VTERREDKERILSALYDYVDLGLPIIPVCSHDHKGYSKRHIETCSKAGKIPLIRGWQAHEATLVVQVDSWLKEFKNINIGLPLGHVSGYVGIDVDGEQGEEILMGMAKGDLPETWEYITGAGRRLLYEIPVGLQTKKSVNTGTGKHEECSIMAAGQQTVLPPSIHHTGKLYEWLEDHAPQDIDCAMAPKWLIDLVRVDKPSGIISSINFSKDIPEVNIEEEEEAAEINPILVTDTVLPSEFSDFDTLDIDLTPPDVSFVGKKAKTQEEDGNKITQEELLQKLTEGSRDNQMTRIIGSFCAQFRGVGKDYIMLMAKNHNSIFCEPPLSNSAIEAKVNHFWETEQMKSAQFKNLSADGSEKKRFAPGHIAEIAIALLEESGHCLKIDSDQPVVWITRKEAGPWYPLDSRSGVFHLYIREALGDPKNGGDPTWTTVKHYKDVANAIVIELRAAGRIWKTSTQDQDTQTLEGFDYIPLAGGKLLDWRKGEVKPWDPETNLTYVLPVEFDPIAKAPNWDMRLKEWLPDADSRLIMQEFIGYSLIPYMGFEKALVIQGEGANGKSIFLEAIQGLLGYKVVDSINMRNLFSRFGQADLLGKILNIVNEAGSEYLRGGHADDFKNLVSGGRVKADVKNQAMLTFNNTAKFIFASNHDIKTGDKSEGWLRRMLLVPFDQDFRKSTVPKYEIMEELRSEYAGIFNWAVEGLRRLMHQKDFSHSVTADRKKLAYTQENDITADFFMNCLETFELTAYSSNNKLIRSGTPSSLINMLFSFWIEYRESTVLKKVDHISKYLEKKHTLYKARTTHTLHTSKVMTECWIGLRINVRDAGFLEELINQPVMKYPELKEYAVKRLAELDASDGYDDPGPRPERPVIEMMTAQAK